jgi:hypothetical protein
MTGCFLSADLDFTIFLAGFGALLLYFGKPLLRKHPVLQSGRILYVAGMVFLIFFVFTFVYYPPHGQGQSALFIASTVLIILCLVLFIIHGYFLLSGRARFAVIVPITSDIFFPLLEKVMEESGINFEDITETRLPREKTGGWLGRMGRRKIERRFYRLRSSEVEIQTRCTPEQPADGWKFESTPSAWMTFNGPGAGMAFERISSGIKKKLGMIGIPKAPVDRPGRYKVLGRGLILMAIFCFLLALLPILSVCTTWLV